MINRIKYSRYNIDEIFNAEKWRREKITELNIDSVINEWLKNLKIMKTKSVFYWKNNNSIDLMKEDMKAFNELIKIAELLKFKRINIAKKRFQKFKQKEQDSNYLNIYKIPGNINYFLNEGELNITN